MLELNALREEEGLELLEVLITKVPAFLEQTVLLMVLLSLFIL